MVFRNVFDRTNRYIEMTLTQFERIQTELYSMRTDVTSTTANCEQFKKFSACTCWRSGFYPKCWWRNRMLLVSKSFSRNVSTMTSHSKPHSCSMAGSVVGDHVLAAWGCIKELCSTTTSNFGKYKGENTESCRERLL